MSWRLLFPGTDSEHLEDSPNDMYLAVAGTLDSQNLILAGDGATQAAKGGTAPGTPPFVWSVMMGQTNDVIAIADKVIRETTGDLQQRKQPHGRIGTWNKRALDIAVAGLTLVLVSPLLLMVAAAIRISMGSPVFYAHPRVGSNGKVFACLKFRTMVNDATSVLDQHLASCPRSASEWKDTRKLFNDPRVTWLGRLLRRSSIDELPQIINVLKGEMSCVGPRPVVNDELAPYGAYVHDYLSVRPGLTGIWQVSGRNTLSYANRVKLDALYVRQWSMRLDLVILLKTVPALLRFEETA